MLYVEFEFFRSAGFCLIVGDEVAIVRATSQWCSGGDESIRSLELTQDLERHSTLTAGNLGIKGEDGCRQARDCQGKSACT
jgi:hypothetical protein